MDGAKARNAVQDFLRDEFHREQESNFALLRRIPSTDVRKFVDYFSALNESGQNALSEALVQVALYRFFPSPSHPGQSGNEAYKRYRDTIAQMGDWRYQDPRTMRMFLAAAEKEPESSFGRWMTPEIKKMILAIRPVKSTEIRRVVKLAFSQLFTPLTVEHGERFWNYSGNYQDNEVCVSVDYAGRYHQLEYQISVRSRTRGIRLPRLSYERLMGLSFAYWDCLEQSNLDQSIALLKDVVIFFTELPRRYPA